VRVLFLSRFVLLFAQFLREDRNSCYFCRPRKNYRNIFIKLHSLFFEVALAAWPIESCGASSRAIFFVDFGALIRPEMEVPRVTCYSFSCLFRQKRGVFILWVRFGGFVFRAASLGLGTTDSNIKQEGRKGNVTPRYRMRATALCARNIHLAVDSASQKSKQIGHQRKKAVLTVRATHRKYQSRCKTKKKCEICCWIRSYKFERFGGSLSFQVLSPVVNPIRVFFLMIFENWRRETFHFLRKKRDSHPWFRTFFSGLPFVNNKSLNFYDIVWNLSRKYSDRLHCGICPHWDCARLECIEEKLTSVEKAALVDARFISWQIYCFLLDSISLTISHLKHFLCSLREWLPISDFYKL